MPAIWLPGPEVRSARERDGACTSSITAAPWRTGSTPRSWPGHPCPVTDLFGTAGLALVGRLELPVGSGLLVSRKCLTLAMSIARSRISHRSASRPLKLTTKGQRSKELHGAPGADPKGEPAAQHLRRWFDGSAANHHGENQLLVACSRRRSISIISVICCSKAQRRGPSADFFPATGGAESREVLAGAQLEMELVEGQVLARRPGCLCDQRSTDAAFADRQGRQDAPGARPMGADPAVVLFERCQLTAEVLSSTISRRGPRWSGEAAEAPRGGACFLEADLRNGKPTAPPTFATSNQQRAGSSTSGPFTWSGGGAWHGPSSQVWLGSITRRCAPAPRRHGAIAWVGGPDQDARDSRATSPGDGPGRAGKARARSGGEPALLRRARDVSPRFFRTGPGR